MNVMKHLEATVLEMHAAAFIDRLDSNNEKERNVVKVLLTRLEPDALLKNVSLIADKFWSNTAHTDAVPQAKQIFKTIPAQDLKSALGFRSDASDILKEVHPEAVR